MSAFPPCPKCQSEYTYEEWNLMVCSDCDYRWIEGADREITDISKIGNDERNEGQNRDSYD